MAAGDYFLEKPMDKPFIPSWNRVISAIPDILDQLKVAVEADNDEFKGERR
jgi:glucosyl-3-phosphoglycerate synthase